MLANMKISGLRVAAILVAASVAGVPWSANAETYGFDKNHTEVRFHYNHLGMSIQSGQFGAVDGTVVFDRKKLENSKVEVVIKTDSVDTGVPALDTHLKSKDFFEVDKYPEITFKSTSVKQTSKDAGRMTGDLTIHGVTKPVTLNVKFNFAGAHPLAKFIKKYDGADYASFSAQAEILRSEFGVGLYAPGTADRIQIVIETELRQKN
ncbi:MAG: YceI family protein [Methyloligellaceae bacterium]